MMHGQKNIKLLKTELMLIFTLFSWPAVGLLPLIYQTIL